MRPEKQSVPINFSGGLDTKTDPWQVGPIDFLVMNNSVFTTGGRLTKRNGFAGLGTVINPTDPFVFSYSNLGSNLSSATKVFAYQNELLVNDRFNLYSYDQSNNGWTYKGRSTIVGLNTESIAQDVHSKVEMDCSIDTTSGVKIYAWYENDISDIVKFSIQDLATGQFIVNKAIFGVTYISPRCLSIAGKSFIFAVNTVDNKIYALSITGQTIGSIVPIVTDLHAIEYFYDVDFISGNIYLAYYTSAPGIKIEQLNSSLAIVNSITKAGETADSGLSIFGDGTNIWVVYNNGTQTKEFIVNDAVTATVLAPTIVDAAAPSVLNVTGTWSNTLSLAFIFYDNVSSPSSVIKFNTSTVGGVVGTPHMFMRSVGIVSKAFSVSGIPHIVSAYEASGLSGGGLDELQVTYFLLNLYNWDQINVQVPANIAAKIAPDASGGPAAHGWMCGVHNVSGNIWELALGQRTDISFATSPTTSFSPFGVIDCQFDFSLSNPDVQVLANDAHIASGELIMYDGSNVVEQNFHIFPDNTEPTISNVGGSMGSASENTLYSYQITYEWQDNSGQLHRSSPSPTVTPLVPGQAYTFHSGTVTGSISLKIPTLRVTNKSGVTVNIYRTIGNGSVYFLVSSSFGQAANDPTIDFVTYVDGESDDLIILNNQLYTTGELEDFAPPAARALSTFKNRILLVPAEGGFDFYYSKQVLIGSPVEFSPSFDQNIGTVGGPLTTIAGMDDKIILFKSGLSVGPSILYMVGTGPAPSGANNDFTDPLPVAVDCGCVDRSSVVLTPNGLIFKSDKGVYLLDRSLQASYIGAPVEAFNQYSVLSSSLIPNTTQVRFLLSNGTLLMYDYFYGKWATFSNPPGISDCIFQGQHTYVGSNGQVYKETPGVYVDGASTPVLMNFTTSWIKLAGLQGYQRAFFFFLLAEYISSHQLSISLYTNFSSAADQTDVITPDSANFLENWRIFFKNQRCQSFQIAIQEIYGGTPGAAFTMSGLNLIVGAKSRFRTISADQSVG